MSSSETGKTMSQEDNIPADLLEEILYLIPSNDLMNFKRVCKDWNELISSHRFIHKHLHRSFNGARIVALRPSGITVCDDPTEKKIRSSTIPYPPEFSVNNTLIVGSCDGLICLVRRDSSEFAVINPSTGKLDVRRTTDGTISDPRRHLFWFGENPCTGEYLIIAIESMVIGKERPSYMIRVCEFSSTLLSSHDFSIPALIDADAKPILFHGALLWAGFRGFERDLRFFVLAYDIEKKKLMESLTPFKYGSCNNVTLGIVDGCLFATIHPWQGRTFEFWIMKEYGVEESWTKLYKVEGFDKCGNFYPLGFLADGDLVLDVGGKGKIVKYSFGDMEASVVLDDLEKYYDVAENSAVLCADSLVSPAVVWGLKTCLDD